MTNQSPAEVLASWFVFNGLLSRPTSNTTWPVTTSSLPDDMPDNRVCIYNTGTIPEGKLMTTGEELTRPECQIRVRSKPASVGYSKLVDLINVITKVQGESIETDQNVKVTIVAVHLISGPAHIGQEEKNQRQHHTANFHLVLVPGT